MAQYQCLNCGALESSASACCKAPDLFPVNDMAGEIKRLRTELTESQAREKMLRDAMKGVVTANSQEGSGGGA